MSDPIATASGAITIAQTIAGVAAKIGPLLTKIRDKPVRDELHDRFFELRTAAMQLQEQNFALQEELRSLKEARAARETLSDFRRQGNVYYRGADGAGPFCSACLEEHGKARTLIQLSTQGSRGDCPICKTEYYEAFEAVPQAPFVLRAPRNPRLAGLEDL